MNPGRPPRWKSPWLWIGLSCGVLFLGVVGLVVAVNYTMFKAYREVRGQPILVLAEMAARKDPNVQVVSRDPKAPTVTLRNQKTGERFVLGQTTSGNLRIQTEAAEVALDLSKPYPGWTLELGSAAGPMPSWIPGSPGTQSRPLYSLNTGGVASGCFLLVPAGPPEDVMAFYRGELGRQGFKLVPGDSLSASSPDFSASVFVTPTEQKGRSGLLLTWSKMTGNPRTGNP